MMNYFKYLYQDLIKKYILISEIFKQLNLLLKILSKK